MQKTRLGISVGMLGATIYLSGLFGGYVAILLLAGYSLLFEENIWLKKSAVKAVALLLFFSFSFRNHPVYPRRIGSCPKYHRHF